MNASPSLRQARIRAAAAAGVAGRRDRGHRGSTPVLPYAPRTANRACLPMPGRNPPACGSSRVPARPAVHEAGHRVAAPAVHPLHQDTKRHRGAPPHASPLPPP